MQRRLFWLNCHLRYERRCLLCSSSWFCIQKLLNLWFLSHSFILVVGLFRALFLCRFCNLWLFNITLILYLSSDLLLPIWNSWYILLNLSKLVSHTSNFSAHILCLSSQILCLLYHRSLLLNCISSVLNISLSLCYL